MNIFVAIIFGVFLFGTLGGVSLAGMFLPAFQPELRGGVILLIALIVFCSGVTEAACKTLVKARLCQSVMQWTREGAQSVLTLRALLLSPSRWTSLWKHFDQHGF
jgi:hypothetical protein